MPLPRGKNPDSMKPPAKSHTLYAFAGEFSLFAPGPAGRPKGLPYGVGPGLCVGVTRRSCLSLWERCPSAHTGAERVRALMSTLSGMPHSGMPALPEGEPRRATARASPTTRHCEPVRTPAWQSVPLRAGRIRPYRESPDSMDSPAKMYTGTHSPGIVLCLSCFRRAAEGGRPYGEEPGMLPLGAENALTGRAAEFCWLSLFAVSVSFCGG